jgi:hypothetical protein
MSTTITNFKKQVANYMNRTLTTLTSVDSQDMVLAAMNNARRAAQRDYAFELNRKDTFLTTSVAGANWMTGCKTTPGGATAQLMRRIDTVWQYSTDAAGNYVRSQRIDLGNVNDYRRELPVNMGTVGQLYTNPTSTQRPFAYFEGQSLKVTTFSASTTFLLNGIAFLDDFTGSEDPDIFLTYFTDWFLWATIIQMNLYVKDSERFPVDLPTVDRLWKSVKEFDGQIANSGDGANLD